MAAVAAAGNDRSNRMNNDPTRHAPAEAVHVTPTRSRLFSARPFIVSGGSRRFSMFRWIAKRHAQARSAAGPSPAISTEHERSVLHTSHRRAAVAPRTNDRGPRGGK